MQSGTPPPLTEGTATWTGSPKELPAEEDAMEVVDYNPPWTARERVSEGEMERYLEKSDSIKVEVIELDRAARHTSRQRNRSRR